MIYVCTTALNRPDLHSKVLLTNKNFFDVETTWIINIDCIEYLKFTFDETSENYKKLLTNPMILQKSEKPSFTLAVKKICNYLLTVMKPNDILFWFEDDWTISKNTDENKCKLSHYIQYINDNVAFHIYQKFKIQNFYPILRGYNFAMTFIETILKIPDHTKDPEVIFSRTYPSHNYDIYLIKNNINEPIFSNILIRTISIYKYKSVNTIDCYLGSELPKKLTMYVYNNLIFTDAGKEYMSDNNIIKNEKGIPFYSIIHDKNK